MLSAKDKKVMESKYLVVSTSFPWRPLVAEELNQHDLLDVLNLLQYSCASS